MNNTKKLTQGAMLLAIVGALMVVDRQLLFVFTEFILLAMPVIIIIYSTKYELKDGLILTCGLIILTFIIGDVMNYMFLPISILVGIAYSLGLKNNLSKRKLMFIAVLIYIVGEFITTLLIQPIFGLNIFEEIPATFKAIDNNFFNGMLSSSIGSKLSELIYATIPVVLMFTGFLEGWLIHMFSIIFLRRFKIKEIPTTSPLDFKLHPVIAYVSFLSLFGNIYLINYGTENMYLYTAISALSTVGTLILIYVGILFIVNYGVVVLNKNLTLFLLLFILFFTPITLLVLIVFGFLYGAGPLYDYIQRKRSERNEKPN